VAAALLCAARSVAEPAWEREALKIARRAGFLPEPLFEIFDMLMREETRHIFNRMSQTTGDLCLGAARYWVIRLGMRQRGRGIGGFRAMAANEDGRNTGTTTFRS
jgi:hypothetical protein